mmetsp:Transcript_68961/g.109505  ORF Transcript_68961/g.109505 Transcript_68961/m.109505 type:complete len:158 (-) Transcript_68961:206-679(-)
MINLMISKASFLLALVALFVSVQSDDSSSDSDDSLHACPCFGSVDRLIASCACGLSAYSSFSSSSEDSCDPIDLLEAIGSCGWYDEVPYIIMYCPSTGAFFGAGDDAGESEYEYACATGLDDDIIELQEITSEAEAYSCYQMIYAAAAGLQCVYTPI